MLNSSSKCENSSFFFLILVTHFLLRFKTNKQVLQTETGIVNNLLKKKTAGESSLNLIAMGQATPNTSVTNYAIIRSTKIRKKNI